MSADRGCHNDCWCLNSGDDRQVRAALPADFDVNGEHPLEACRRHRLSLTDTSLYSAQAAARVPGPIYARPGLAGANTLW